VSLQTQFLTLWMMFACGCMLGGILDAYRVITGLTRMKRWLIPLFDILYWLGAMVMVFRVLYVSNLGEVRLFVFLGLLAGLAIYYATISTYVMRLVRRLLLWLAACWRFTIRIFRVLVIIPLIYVYRAVLAVLMFFGTATIFLCKFVLQLVYPLWKLLRRLMVALARLLRLEPAFHRARTWISRFKRRL